MNQLEKFIKILEETKHPDTEVSFIKMLIIALRDTDTFNSIFDPSNIDHVHANDAAMEVLAGFGMQNSRHYLELHEIRLIISENSGMRV